MLPEQHSTTTRSSWFSSTSSVRRYPNVSQTFVNLLPHRQPLQQQSAVVALSPQSSSQTSLGNYVVATFLTAAFEGAVLNPIDLLKTRVMTLDKPMGSQWQNFQYTMSNAFQQPMQLWQGARVYTAIKFNQRLITFASQDYIRSWLAPTLPPFAAGMVGGWTAATLELSLYWLDTLKVYQQNNNHGIIESCQKIYQRNGLKSFYEGIGATAVRNFVGSGAGFATLALAQDKLHQYQTSQESGEATNRTSWSADTLASFLATVARVVPTHGLDRIKLMQQTDQVPRGSSFVAAARYIYDQQGIKGFTEGFWARNFFSGFKFFASLLVFYRVKDAIKETDFLGRFEDSEASFEQDVLPANSDMTEALAPEILAQPIQDVTQHANRNSAESVPVPVAASSLSGHHNRLLHVPLASSLAERARLTDTQFGRQTNIDLSRFIADQSTTQATLANTLANDKSLVFTNPVDDQAMISEFLPIKLTPAAKSVVEHDDHIVVKLT